MPLKVSVKTLGCKLNQAESESITHFLVENGYEVSYSADSADACIINTCSVTHIADRKSRHLIRLARKNNPDALIIATGCYSRSAAAELEQMPELDLVVSSNDKNQIAELLNKTFKKSGDNNAGVPANNNFPRTRSMVKIQDGCNNFCSFCIVPFLRGRESSRPPEQIISDIKKREALGYKEVVLTGTRIGGYNSGNINLAKLIKLVLEKSGIERLRFSSLQPGEITPELLDLFEDTRLCRHIHIPLQSGSDAILRKMRRRYTTGEYRRVVQAIKDRFADVAVTTDIIAGFPGESERDFQESFNCYSELNFAKVHVFPYSSRSGTVAAGLPGQVDSKVKKARCEKLLELSERAASAFQQKVLGQTRMVLWEQQVKKNIWSGLSDNYLRILARSDKTLNNRVLPVKLIESGDGYIRGEVEWTIS